MANAQSYLPRPVSQVMVSSTFNDLKEHRTTLIEAISRFYLAATVLSSAPFALGSIQERLLPWSGMRAAGLLCELFTAAVPVNFPHRPILKFLAVNNIVLSLLFFIPTLYAVMVVEMPNRKITSAITPDPTVRFNALRDICMWYAPAITSEKGKPKKFRVDKRLLPE